MILTRQKSFGVIGDKMKRIFVIAHGHLDRYGSMKIKIKLGGTKKIINPK